MAKKYIRIVELAQVTGRPYNEILSLVNTGVLFGHKTHRGRWLINIDAAEKYFALVTILMTISHTLILWFPDFA